MLSGGPGPNAQCCSGYQDATGACEAPPTSGTTGTSGSSGSTGSTGTCVAGCHAGYSCQNGACVLHGTNGPIQVTLEWLNSPRTQADLDLHLAMPAGACPNGEIYFANRTCGSASLDLDANAGCFQATGPAQPGDDTENIIFDPSVTPTSGTYIVRVNDYSNSCSGSADIPYRVTIRTPTVPPTTISGTFHSNEGHSGGAGAGVEIMRFTY